MGVAVKTGTLAALAALVLALGCGDGVDGTMDSGTAALGDAGEDLDSGELRDSEPPPDAGHRGDAAPPIDSGPPPRMCVSPPGECDVYAQDCPEGQKCRPVRTAEGEQTLRCAPVAPGPDSCDAGFNMVGGVCRAWCCEGDSTCTGDRACSVFYENGVGHCVGDPCNPVGAEDEVCGGRSTCRLVGGVTFCMDAPFDQGDGASCDDLADCHPGMQCLRIDGPPVCRVFCRLGAGADACHPRFECRRDYVEDHEAEQIILPDGIGLCLPPGSASAASAGSMSSARIRSSSAPGR
ncbi:MAG: hypothetical protein SangKO_075820 [Sandaracinaceae bacterium]